MNNFLVPNVNQLIDINPIVKTLFAIAESEIAMPFNDPLLESV